MRIRFWGTRGSIPTPGSHTSKYGGNTSCVEVRTDDGAVIVFDCGTGARALGTSLLQEATRPLRIHLLITHTHWDHIQGFPFFAPIFAPDTELSVYAPVGFQQNLEQAMAGQMQYSYFPVKLDELRSRMRFYNVDEGMFNIGGATVETQYLNHTAPTIGYRISSRGASVVYATDHEPFSPARSSLWHPGDARHVEFLNQADLVIHDAQYTDDEYPQKVGWGHSTVNYATDVAVEAGAHRLILTHHDPTHDDVMVERLEAMCQARSAARRSSLEVVAAAEGHEIYLPESAATSIRRGAQTALGPRSLAGAKVLLATDDPAQAQQIADLLSPDGVATEVVVQGAAAVTRARELVPDILILDANLFDRDVFDVAASIRADRRTANIAVIILTPTLDEAAVRRGYAIGLADCLGKPISPPMLHARVRAWLARSMHGRRRSAIVNKEEAGGHRPAPPPERMAGADKELDRKVEVLSHVPVFAPLDRAALQGLARTSRYKTFAAGSLALRQGERSESLFLITSGRVRVFGRGRDNRVGEVLLQELGPGDVFGEMGLIDELPVSASILALTRVRTVVMPGEQVIELLEGSPALSFRMMQMLAKRLREADKLLLRDGPDALTGLVNRRSLTDTYRREVAAARRRGYSLALLHVDVEDLKGINLKYGHDHGDLALQAVADALRASTRQSDIVARDEDDEFIALLTDSELDGASLVVGRLQKRLTELVSQRGLPMPVDIKVRIVAQKNPPETLDDFTQQLGEAQGLSLRRA